MFDIGFFELLVIGILGLVILGPEKMPEAVRLTSALMGRVRRTYLEAKIKISEEIELEEYQQRVAHYKADFLKAFEDKPEQESEKTKQKPSHHE